MANFIALKCKAVKSERTICRSFWQTGLFRQFDKGTHAGQNGEKKESPAQNAHFTQGRMLGMDLIYGKNRI